MLGRLAFGVKGITTDVLLGWAWQAWLGGGGQGSLGGMPGRDVVVKGGHAQGGSDSGTWL